MIKDNNKGVLKSRIATLTTFVRNDRKRVAFTLAEVLITLGIIGIVAAMTIPTLVKNYNEKITVTRVKKAYNVLSNAYKMTELQNDGTFSTWFSPEMVNSVERHEALANYFKPYMKVIKEGAANSGCLASGYVKSLNDINYGNYDASNEYKVLTSDGVVYVFYVEKVSDNEYFGNIKVDINGMQKPYVWGKDFFLFTISDLGIIPEGMPDVVDYYNFDEYCNLSPDKSSRMNGIGCTAWVIKNGNMDYLHCNDLSWNGKLKCSD